MTGGHERNHRTVWRKTKICGGTSRFIRRHPARAEQCLDSGTIRVLRLERPAGTTCGACPSGGSNSKTLQQQRSRHRCAQSVLARRNRRSGRPKRQPHSGAKKPSPIGVAENVAVPFLTADVARPLDALANRPASGRSPRLMSKRLPSGRHAEHPKTRDGELAHAIAQCATLARAGDRTRASSNRRTK